MWIVVRVVAWDVRQRYTLASYLQIEERELDAGGLNLPRTGPASAGPCSAVREFRSRYVNGLSHVVVPLTQEGSPFPSVASQAANSASVPVESSAPAPVYPLQVQ